MVELVQWQIQKHHMEEQQLYRKILLQKQVMFLLDGQQKVMEQMMDMVGQIGQEHGHIQMVNLV